MLTSVVDLLYKEKMTGQMLLDLDESDLKEVVGFLQARNIKQIVKNSLVGVEQEDTKIKIKKKQIFENTRLFGHASKDKTYTKGNLIQHESGPANLLEPAREAKLLEVIDDKDSLDDLMIPFVQRVGKFAMACMNRRCNGTIYFGVGDSRPVMINQKDYMHCEIVGMNITADQVEHFEDAIRTYLRGNDPVCFKKINNTEMKKAVDLSIKPIQVIPILDSTNVVLEIDVEPTSSRCRDLVFQIQLPKSSGKPQDKCYFERVGGHSDQIKKSETKRFLEKTIQMYINERRDLENQQNLCFGDTNVKLTQLLCRSETYINDNDLNYFLISDIAPESLLADENNVQWIRNIEWRGIFDFDPASHSRGLGKHVTPSMQLRQEKQFDIKELANMIDESDSLDAVRRQICYGDRSIWLKCNEEDQDFKTWALTTLDKIR